MFTTAPVKAFAFLHIDVEHSVVARALVGVDALSLVHDHAIGTEAALHARQLAVLLAGRVAIVARPGAGRAACLVLGAAIALYCCTSQQKTGSRIYAE